MKGVIKYTKKNTSSIQSHVLHGHANEFTIFLAFLELRNSAHPDDTYEISTDDDSRKRKKVDEVSVGGILSDYLLPCHHYGDNRPKQREFEVNCFAFVEHVFKLLLLVDHDCFRKLIEDLDPRLHPVGK